MPPPLPKITRPILLVALALFPLNPTDTGDINIVYSMTVIDVTTCASAPTLARREIKGFSGGGFLLRSATVESPTGTAYWCNSLVLRNDRRPLEGRSPSAHRPVPKIDRPDFDDGSPDERPSSELRRAFAAYEYCECGPKVGAEFAPSNCLGSIGA